MKLKMMKMATWYFRCHNVWSSDVHEPVKFDISWHLRFVSLYLIVMSLSVHFFFTRLKKGLNWHIFIIANDFGFIKQWALKKGGFKTIPYLWWLNKIHIWMLKITQYSNSWKKVPVQELLVFTCVSRPDRMISSTALSFIRAQGIWDVDR